MDLDELSEELTIQRVMLNSLDDETYEGVEAEREEHRAEIARVKELIAEAKLGKLPDQQSAVQAEPNYVEPSSAGPSSAGPSSAGPSSAGPSSLLPTFGTPSRGAMADNSSQLSLPSRKRDWDGYSSPRANKSRRTTPTPTPTHTPRPIATFSSPPRNYDDFDVIDLTRDDDDIDAEYLARQRREEARREQEKADREYAQRLSSQDDELGSSSSGSSHGSYAATTSTPIANAHGTAFNRIMETQRLNAANSQQQTWGPSPLGMPQDLPPLIQQQQQPSFPMPGAYNPHWDQQAMAGTSSPTPGGSHNFSNAMMAQPVNAYTAGPHAFQTAGQVHYHDTMNQSLSYTQQHRALMPATHSSYNPMAQPTMQNTRAGGLSDVIKRTNSYDYVNGVDRYGNPLPERVANFVHDVVHDTRVTQQELDNLLQNIRPDMEIPDRNSDGTPEGLKGTLYYHQEIALSWLKSMEEKTNKGGILADDMGLGKTISMISLMLTRPATSRPKTNLIIGPVALLRQWEDEIKDKVHLSHSMSIFVHHGSRKISADELLKYDVVLTTYMTLAAEHKRMEKVLTDSKEQGRQIDYNDKTTMKRFPLLHPKSSFHRVILDEAQCIKNKMTRSAKACCLLKATHRWCLSGTPMMNGIDELYSLLAFLKIKPYCAWEQFRQAFGTLFGKQGDSKSSAMERMRVLLKAIMLRRKKNSTIDGKPILRLPPKTEEIIHVELNEDERDYYKQLEEKSQVLFSKYLRDGSVGKNYSHILVLLLRLRQACCHPHLNLDVQDAALSSTEDILKLVERLNGNIVTRIKEMAADVFECPICYDPVQSPLFFIPCGHDSCQPCLARLTDSAAANNIREGIDTTDGATAKCPVCRSAFDPRKCFSYDAFQKVHMPEAVKDENAEETDSNAGSDSDSDSDSDLGLDSDEVDKQGNLKGFIVDDEVPDSDDESKDLPIEGADKVKGKGKGKGKEKAKKKRRKDKGKDKAADVKPSMLKALRLEAYKNKAAHKQYMAYLRKTWLPSTKVEACMKLLKDIQLTGEKTIIFSQWTLLLDLIEVSMKHENIPTKLVRYDGSMSANQRNNSAHLFRTKKDVKVILVSLKAGNAGLNLADASRVIIMDPFWNPYIEMQAVDRAYRIGQQREVKVYRILTQQTVEDRIIDLQDRKKDLVESALDESAGHKISRLSATELKYLFYGR